MLLRALVPPGAAFWGLGQPHWGLSLCSPSPSSPACPLPAGGPPAPPATPQDKGCLANGCLGLLARCRQHHGSHGSETCPCACHRWVARGDGAAGSPARPRLPGVSSGTRVARLVPEDRRASQKCPAPAAPCPQAAPGSCPAPLCHPGTAGTRKGTEIPGPLAGFPCVDGIPVLPAASGNAHPSPPRAAGPRPSLACGNQSSK